MKKHILRAAMLAVAVIMSAAMLVSCTPSPVLMTVDGTNVTNARFNYYCNTIKKSMETSSGYALDTTKQVDESGTTLGDVIKKSAYDQLLREFAVLRLARENNVELTDAEKDTVTKSVEATITSLGGKDAYARFLDAYGIQDSDYRTVMEAFALMNKTYVELFNEGGKFDLTDEEKAASIDKYMPNYANVEHVFLSLVDREGRAVSNDVRLRQMSLATEACEKAATEDFDALIGKYSDDATEGQHSVYINQGDTAIPPQYKTAAFALEEGEVSKIVETALGFYVIKRLPFDDSFAEIAEADARNAKIEVMVNDTTSKLAVVKNAEYNAYVVK